MEITIHSSELSAIINPLGAELRSLRNRNSGTEWLWQADPEVWPRCAPVLFPVVGKLKDGKFNFKGKEYLLPQHGFARDSMFEVLSFTESEAVFCLRESEESLRMYPFYFELKITYETKDTELCCTYEVTNIGKDILLFSIGAHPGFLFNQEGEGWKNLHVVFEKNEISPRYLLSNGLFNGETDVVFCNECEIEIHPELFAKDAIVLKDLSSRVLRLMQGEKRLFDFYWENLPYFGIWTKSLDTGFICLEPWAGLADSIDTNGNLEDKEGVVKLSSGETYRAKWGIRF